MNIHEPHGIRTLNTQDSKNRIHFLEYYASRPYVGKSRNCLRKKVTNIFTASTIALSRVIEKQHEEERIERESMKEKNMARVRGGRKRSERTEKKKG